MTRSKAIVWSYWCDADCGADLEVTSGDPTPNGGGAWTNGEADSVARAAGWTLTRSGGTYCPDHRGRRDR